jgi:hypothetical protein
MDSQLAEYDAMYSASIILREILDCFMIFHEVMVEPKLKQHLEILVFSEELPTQYESI